ncbi:MAG: hypothetical protein HY548_02885, partial [Elusimicrobia bacterium]|nr:hypothetical protein [Elusimicrobiota bacterium]
MKFLARISRTLSLALAVVYFLNNCVLANIPESNFWSERRKRVEDSRRADTSPTLVAALPSRSTPSTIVSELPSLERFQPNPALSSHIREKILTGPAARYAPLLNALPYAYGTARKVVLPKTGASGKIVIHIQDVHLNSEAQKNIGQTVQSLLSAKAGNDIGLIALEGASETILVERFRAYPRKGAVKEAADFLLNENQISGPIHTALVSPARIPAVIGIDDPRHYAANKSAYIRSAPRMEEWRQRLAAREKDLEATKASVLNPTLREFDRQVSAYRRGESSLGVYVKTLAGTRASAVPLNAVPGFLEALAMESALDFGRVEAERSRVIEALVEKLNKKQIADLITRSVAYRAGQLRHADFYAGLRDSCRWSDVDLSRFPAMDGYIRYVLAADSVDAETLFEELKSLEAAAYKTLARTTEEKALVSESRSLSLTQKLVNFSLSPEEWNELKSRRDADPGLSSFAAFYEEAQARDETMAANLLRALEGNKASAAVLVTGGFHARSLEERLQRAGVAVISFTPKVTKVDAENGSAYLGVFTQEKTPLEKLFEGEKLFLSPDPAGGLKRLPGQILAQEVLQAWREGRRGKELTAAARKALEDMNLAEKLEADDAAVEPSLDDTFRLTLTLSAPGKPEADPVRTTVILDGQGRIQSDKAATERGSLWRRIFRLGSTLEQRLRREGGFREKHPALYAIYTVFGVNWESVFLAPVLAAAVFVPGPW